MSDRLDQRLCPCGAERRPGSGYCGWDCEPLTPITPVDVDDAKPGPDPWADVMP